VEEATLSTELVTPESGLFEVFVSVVGVALVDTQPDAPFWEALGTTFTPEEEPPPSGLHAAPYPSKAARSVL
jgi:hypothetical protein